MLNNKENFNVNIILALYSSIGIHLLEIREFYKFNDKSIINKVLKEIKALDSKVSRVIVSGTVDDFDMNAGEIAEEFDKMLYSSLLKTYYSFVLIEKLHKDIDFRIFKASALGLKDNVNNIDNYLRKFFKNNIDEKDKTFDLKLFEEKIVKLFE